MAPWWVQKATAVAVPGPDITDTVIERNNAEVYERIKPFVNVRLVALQKGRENSTDLVMQKSRKALS